MSMINYTQGYIWYSLESEYISRVYLATGMYFVTFLLYLKKS